MVMSDGIPLLLALARMESQEIACLSVAMLQRILSYDTRYKRVVLSVTKDPELIRLIEEGASPPPTPPPPPLLLTTPSTGESVTSCLWPCWIPITSTLP